MFVKGENAFVLGTASSFILGPVLFGDEPAFSLATEPILVLVRCEFMSIIKHDILGVFSITFGICTIHSRIVANYVVWNIFNILILSWNIVW